jgi:hypothetical protein
MMIGFSDTLDSVANTNKTIGNSEIKGEIATSIPSFFPFFKVSETTKVTSGPGDKPAAKPTIIPKRREIASKILSPFDLVPQHVYSLPSIIMYLKKN